jgi:succinate-acetate transporter protein
MVPARIGHALPIGAAGFAWCSLALGLSTAGLMNTAGSSVILSGTFFYGGIVQLVAGFFALAAGATFVAAFLTAYGAFWLGYTAIEVYVAPHIVASVLASGAPGASKQTLAAQAGHDVVQALGVFLVAWLVVTVIFTVASLGTNAVTVAAFGLLDLAIVLLVIAYLGASSAGAPVTGELHAAGWVEIVLAGVAFYIVLAELANETLHRQLFPLFPLRGAAVRPA